MSGKNFGACAGRLLYGGGVGSGSDSGRRRGIIKVVAASQGEACSLLSCVESASQIFDDGILLPARMLVLLSSRDKGLTHRSNSSRRATASRKISIVGGGGEGAGQEEVVVSEGRKSGMPFRGENSAQTLTPASVKLCCM